MITPVTTKLNPSVLDRMPMTAPFRPLPTMSSPSPANRVQIPPTAPGAGVGVGANDVWASATTPSSDLVGPVSSATGAATPLSPSGRPTSTVEGAGSAVGTAER